MTTLSPAPETPQTGFLFRTTPQLCEFDLGGVLYHANYFHVYEQAREALLQTGGTPYPELVANSQHLAIVESHQEFVKPVRYGDQLLVQLWITELKRATCIVNYRFLVEQDAKTEVYHRAWTKHVFVQNQPTGFRIQSFTDRLNRVFAAYAAEQS